MPTWGYDRGLSVRKILSTALCCASAVGCGAGEVPFEIEFEEFCGERGPVLLLELEPDQHISRNALHAIRRVDDRLIFLVENYAEGAEFPAASEDDIESRSVYSTGPCGEDPALIGEDIDFLYDHRFEYGDSILACRRESAEVLLLDPTGQAEPRVLLEDVDCAPLPAGAGIVGVQRSSVEQGTLVFRPSLTDPDAPLEVLLDDVYAPFIETGFYFVDIRRMRTTGSKVFTISPDGDIVMTDVEDHSSEVVVTDVAGFELSFDGRFILYQPGPVVVSGGTWDTREMFLFDRETGETLALGNGRFGLGTGGIQPGLVRVNDDLFGDDTKIVLLPELTELSFTPEQFVNGRHEPSGYVMWSVSDKGTPGPLHVFDPDTGESTEVFDRHGGWTTFGEQFLMLEQTGEESYSFWERYLDQSEPVLVAEDTFQPWFVTEDKIAFAGDLDGARIGNLYIGVRESEDREVLDENVNAFSSRINWNLALGEAFAWAVSDGDRSGIYAAQVK